jgi:molybdenum cofactor synthesis domain-containing protein
MRVGILTVSDGCSAGTREDRSGALIEAWAGERGYRISARAVVPDDTARIVPLLAGWCDDLDVDLVLTTGGTGLTPRDVTPEATRGVLEKEAPGIVEEIRRRGVSKTPYSALSRGVAGTRGGTLVVNLPGSPGGVRDGLDVLDLVVDHAVALSRGYNPSHEGPTVGGAA